MLLPAELWSSVIEHLPPSQQRTCLFVSRLHHDLAVQFLFSVVKIRVHSERWDFSTDDPDTSLVSRSWELLDNIVHSPQFAKAVKKMVVYYANGNMIFERRCVAKALEYLPNLRSVHWLGFPRIPDDIVQALVKFCPQLQELRYPLNITTWTPALADLHHLYRLQFTTPATFGSLFYDPTLDLDIELGDCSHVLDMVNGSSRTLRELDLLGSQVGDISIRILSSLTHLEIWVPIDTQLRGLDLIFHHAVCLESLVLAGAIGLDVYPILQKSLSLLPQLNSFQLCSYVDCFYEECLAISEFIRRPLLRRLCLRLHTSWQLTCMILAAIRELPELQVLGLYTGHEQHFVYDDFEYLALHLPPTLRLLHLAIVWDTQYVDSWMLTPLFEELARMPFLWFLQLMGVNDNIPLSPEDLVHDLKHLEILGAGLHFWDILRTESEVTLTQWPPQKVTECVKEDFGGADGAWLLKHS